MTPERWQQITKVFHSALERDANSRSRFLDEACGTDDEFRAEVEAMLKAHGNAGSFGEEPAFSASISPSEFVTAGRESVASPAPPADLSESPRTNPSRGIPWLMIVIGASFIATLVFFLYVTVNGPADPVGIDATFSSNTMQIPLVAPDSPFAQGGLRAGDRVLTIDGQPMRVPRDWTAAAGNMQVGQPQVWVVSRQGENVRLEIVYPPARIRQRLIEGYVQVLSLTLSALPLGLLIAWKRPHDSAARIGAWFMITASFAFGLPPGWAVFWREFPMLTT